MPRPLSLPNLNYCLLLGSLVSSSSSLSSCWGRWRRTTSIAVATVTFQVIILNGLSSALWAISSYFTNAIAEVQREAEIISDINAVLYDNRGNGFALNLELWVEEVLNPQTNASTSFIEIFLNTKVIHPKPTSIAL